MTDEITAEEFAALKERVAALEERLDEKDGNHSATEQTGLDHRDAAVIAEMEHGGTYSGLQVKRMFKKYTDIRQEKTAKERAKALTNKDVFKQTRNGYTYRGE